MKPSHDAYSHLPLSAFTSGLYLRSTFQLILVISLMTIFPACQGPGMTKAPWGEESRITACLEQAQEAWQVLQQETPETPSAKKALLTYNRSVEQLVKLIRKRGQPDSRGQEILLGGVQPRRLTFDASFKNGSAKTFALSDFSRCRLASEIKLQGFDREVSRHGLGVPVILSQDDPQRTSNPFHPAQGEFFPATAVLEFPAARSNQPNEVRLHFYNPLVTSDVKAGRQSLPLAENLTASLQCSLTDEIPDGKQVPLAHDEVESQLFFLNRYDKTKVPVVFIHGLRCGPSVWKNSINELFADPDLRRRYQPVCFIYPTQLSIPASAARLRELLNLSRDKLDPDHDNAGFGNVVLVGHSMGGLLARMQVIDSGNDFWQAFFTASPREIAKQVDAKTAALVKDSLFFKRQSNVKTVVFISTPHRGSVLADYGVIRVLARILLILPKTAGKHLQALTTLPAAYIHPTLRSFHDWGAEGTENLSTKHPYFRALAQRPIGVPYHSIIASRHAADLHDSDDGCVPYWSSHLDGAVSETIVPYRHACLEKQATVQALLKILKGNK